MVDPNDVKGDALLQRVIEHLRRQEISDFPDPEIAAPERTRKHASAVHSIFPVWGMVMDRRFQLSAGAMAGLAAVLGFLLIWEGNVAQPVSAMERMAEAVRKAKSYKYSATGKSSLAAKSGDPRQTTETTMTKYWLAPDSLRLDITVSGDKWRGPGPELSNIAPGLNKPAIKIDNRAKTFRHLPPNGRRDFSPLYRLDDYGKFSGNADRELGARKINGREALGFVIDARKIDPLGPPQMMEIWIDSRTNLPVLVRCDSKTESGSITEEISDIQWNIDLDPKLFDVRPPEGYTDVSPKDVTADLRKALSDSDPAVRSIAACTLGKIASPTEAIISDLRKALHDRDKAVRAMAAWSLGQMGPAARNALPDLQKALSDGDPNVRSEAASALKKIEHGGK